MGKYILIGFLIFAMLLFISCDKRNTSLVNEKITYNLDTSKLADPNTKKMLSLLTEKQYIDSSLTYFYDNFKQEIKSVFYIDEPPAILQRVAFKASKGNYIEIVLKDLPTNIRYDTTRESKWNLDILGKYKVFEIYFETDTSSKELLQIK